jgi:hypothetical protein
VTCEIVGRICAQDDNRAAMHTLSELRSELARDGIAVKTRYIIGNHDRLINQFGDARTRVADFLGLSNPRRFESQVFQREAYWEDYSALARHGDIYDPLSYDGEGRLSSLAHAFVIDLLIKFPLRVVSKIGRDGDPELVARLERLHYMRPLVDAPLLVRGACLRARTPEIAETVKRTWNELVDEFLEIPFVSQHEVPWRLNMVDALQFGLKLSRHLSIRDIEHMPLRHLQSHSFLQHALEEDVVQSGQARNIIYAHTHEARMAPLETVEADGSTRCRIYFNAGTWRPVYRRTEFDHDKLGFLCWHSLTALALYLPKERRGRSFEMWTGALDELPLSARTPAQMGRYTSALQQAKAADRLY